MLGIVNKIVEIRKTVIVKNVHFKSLVKEEKERKNKRTNKKICEICLGWVQKKVAVYCVTTS